MKVEFLKAKKDIILHANTDAQYVLIPQGEINCEVQLTKEGISVDLIVPFSFSDNQDVKLRTTTLHVAPNTKCTVNVKGVLKDAAKFDYIGKIIISKSAQQTVSYLEDNVLVVGDKTKNYSQPILEIEADDVKASHGATTGRIDESHLYYLMSRGLSKSEAESIIVDGYLSSVLDLIVDEKVKAKALKKLNV